MKTVKSGFSGNIHAYTSKKKLPKPIPSILCSTGKHSTTVHRYKYKLFWYVNTWYVNTQMLEEPSPSDDRKLVRMPRNNTGTTMKYELLKHQSHCPQWSKTSPNTQRGWLRKKHPLENQHLQAQMAHMDKLWSDKTKIKLAGHNEWLSWFLYSMSLLYLCSQ